MGLKEKAFELAVQNEHSEAEQAEADRREAVERSAQFEERLRRDAAEAPKYILETFGVRAELTGVIRHPDSANPGGVQVRLLNDAGERFTDDGIGRYARTEADREVMSHAMYITEGEETPLLLTSAYCPEQGEFVANGGGYDAIELWNALHTVMRQQWPSGWVREISEKIDA